MTGFMAEMRPTFQLATTRLTTANISKPALLVLQCLLAAKACLLDQEWTPWAVLVIRMTIVRHLWMTACFWSFTVVSTWRGLRAAR